MSQKKTQRHKTIREKTKTTRNSKFTHSRPRNEKNNESGGNKIKTKQKICFDPHIIINDASFFVLASSSLSYKITNDFLNTTLFRVSKYHPSFKPFHHEYLMRFLC